jgi:ergothioneine biosynthesis protein EgtB
MADRLVTNGEFREFVRSGAYAESEWWLSDGFALLDQTGWDRPLYWSADLESEFTLAGWQLLDPARPVCHVSYYEADAYARWSAARLPTEFELELAAVGTEISGNTLERGSLHPEPASVRTEEEAGQIWGDVWEWTASAYAPYPRFRPLAGSLGEYNGKFMANQMVVRGGSCVSSASHLRASYRSFFYPHDRWQFLGFRLVRDRGS